MKFKGITLEYASSISVYAVFAYVINILFFLPLGDEYLKELLLLSGLLCLGLRKVRGLWGVQSVGAFFFPLLAYTAILVLSYLVNGGFTSTVRMFVLSSFFVYGASTIRIKPQVVAWLCVLAAFEVLLFMFRHALHQSGARFGVYSNPIFFGMFSCCMSIVSIYLGMVMQNRLLRFLLFFGVVVFIAATTLTQTRGVVLAYLPLLLIFVIFLYRKHFISVRLVSGVVVSATILAVLVINSGHLLDRFARMNNQLEALVQGDSDTTVYRTSVGFRLLMWKFSLVVAEEHPFFGAGRDRFQQYRQEWSDSGRFPKVLGSHMPNTHVHNQYLQDLAMRGSVGLVALLALFVVPAVRGVKTLRSGPIKCHYAGYMLVSIMVAFATFSLTEVALKHPEKIALFTTVGLLSTLLCQYRPEPEAGGLS